MIPKKNRLNRANFGKVLEKSKKIEGETLSIRVRYLNNEEISRFSVVVSSKVASKAVDRNLLRRRIYAVLQKNPPKTAVFLVVYTKKGAAARDFTAINKELGELLRRV